MIHFNVAGSVSGEIQKRSNQENFDLCAKCEELLISAASMRERKKLRSREKAFWWRWGCFKVGCSEWCSIRCSEKMKDVVSSTLAFTSNCNIFSEVRKLLQLMYVMPVITASAKRSFSFTGHLKTLPPNDHQCAPQRLNHLMTLSVYRNYTESLNVQ